ncbi:MAG: hypothetical protein JKY67_17255 [Pseudomonadales bacterium]|nr:hypothetical protein [Pseudomonadales bacterium]
MLTLTILSISSLRVAEIVVHESALEDQLTTNDLKLIFFGTKTHWQDGQPITLCIDQSGEEAIVFYKKVLNKNIRAYKRYWTKRLFSGNASTIPRYLNTSAKVLEYVSKKEGAICFIARLPEILPEGVKKIKIID